MGSKIDLQIQSIHSDGIDTPAEIVEMAKQHGVEVISITDHDTVAGVQDAMNRGQRLGVTVIPGVEITVRFRGAPLHILGYHIDITNNGLLQLLSDIVSFRKQVILAKIPEINGALHAAGKPPIDPVNLSWEELGYPGKPNLARYLLKEGIVGDTDDAFPYLKCITSPDLAPPHVQPKDAIAAIHRAGGIAVLSHLLAPKVSLKVISPRSNDHEAIISQFKQQGLDGLECYQACHSAEDTARCLALAKRYSLTVTGGSDWHGPIEKTGQHIKQYIPFYVSHIGALPIPETLTKNILSKGEPRQADGL